MIPPAPGYSPRVIRPRLDLLTLAAGSILAVGIVSSIHAGSALNPTWPAPAPVETLTALAHAPVADAAAPSAEAVFFDADFARDNWYRAYENALSDHDRTQYEFDESRPGERVRATPVPGKHRPEVEDGALVLLGRRGVQRGIALPPELWAGRDTDFVLGLEIRLTDLDLPTYYLSTHISQGGRRGEQRWLTSPLSEWTRVEFPARHDGGRISIGHRGNGGTLQIRRLYLREPGVDDHYPWSAATDAADMPVALAIDTSASAPANPKLFGISPNLFQSRRGFGSEEVRNTLRGLGVRALRFPTGTQSNWYEWDRDGWRPPEELPAGIPRFVAGSTAQLRRHREGRYGLADYQDFVAAERIAPVIVLNLNTATPENQRDWAASLRAAGTGARHFELGNETYHRPQASEATATAEGYVAHAARYAAAIREVAPDARFAVPIQSRPIRPEGDTWNTTVTSAPFADGAVLHTYTMMFGVPFNRELTAALLHPELQLAEKVLQKRRDYPHLKIWNTEWGVNAPPHSPAASQLRALQTAAYLLALVEWQSDFELATLHCLGTGEFSLVELAGDAPILLKRPYFTFHLLAPLFAEGATWLGTAVVDPAAAPAGGAPVSARAFRSADGSLGLVAINRHPVARRLAPTLDDRPLGGGGELRSLSADTLRADDAVALGRTLVERSDFSDTPVLPPYSVNLVLFRQGIPAPATSP